MLEVKEVLRLWLGGAANKRIAAQLGLNVKTVRRYGGAARASGVGQEAGPEALDDGLIAAVLSRVQPHLGRPRGDGWAAELGDDHGPRPWVRGLAERFESRLLPLFKRRTEGVGQLLQTLYFHELAEGAFDLAPAGPAGRRGAAVGELDRPLEDPGRRERLGGIHRELGGPAAGAEAPISLSSLPWQVTD